MAEVSEYRRVTDEATSNWVLDTVTGQIAPIVDILCAEAAQELQSFGLDIALPTDEEIKRFTEEHVNKIVPRLADARYAQNCRIWDIAVEPIIWANLANREAQKAAAAIEARRVRLHSSSMLVGGIAVAQVVCKLGRPSIKNAGSYVVDCQPEILSVQGLCVDPDKPELGVKLIGSILTRQSAATRFSSGMSPSSTGSGRRVGRRSKHR